MMLEKPVGNLKARSVIEKLISSGISGRTLIFNGPPGVGKFTFALWTASNILNKNPFFDRDFLFYRNDDFFLKTSFIMKLFKENGLVKENLLCYFFYLLGRAATSLEFEEINDIKLRDFSDKNKFNTLGEFIIKTNSLLLNGDIFKLINENEIFCENLLKISQEISKKNTISVNVIRKIIEFDSLKSLEKKKVIIIGNFEDATIEAQNASLKLFEEPSLDTILILTVSNLFKVLPTIRSRSIIINFHHLNLDELKEIFGIKNIDGYNVNNTLRLMREHLYSYSTTSKEKVIYFFENIALSIQKTELFFEFVDQLIGEEKEFLIHFFKEIVNFLREVHLCRQFGLRGYNKYNSFYKEYIELIKDAVFVSELHYMGNYIFSTIERLYNESFSTYSIVVDSLIKLARWYQKVLLRKKKKN